MKENREENFVQDSCIPKLWSSHNSTATRLLRRVKNLTERTCNKQRKISKRHCWRNVAWLLNFQLVWLRQQELLTKGHEWASGRFTVPTLKTLTEQEAGLAASQRRAQVTAENVPTPLVGSEPRTVTLIESKGLWSQNSPTARTATVCVAWTSYTPSRCHLLQGLVTKERLYARRSSDLALHTTTRRCRQQHSHCCCVYAK